MYSPPEKPLIVKCTFDKWHKRITFNSARNCSYELLRHKVEECFSLSATSYAISYKDDDGEITNIATDADLIEAIQYFQAGDDPPLSSAASILSGRSFGPKRITVRVVITVDYDGPSLSDTSSLISLEEFKGRNGSQHSFSFGAPSVDLDDDSVTVSSRDPGTSSVRALGNSVTSIAKKSSNTDFNTNNSTAKEVYGRFANGQSPYIPSTNGHSQHSLRRSLDEYIGIAAQRYPADPSAVFERLKLSENLRDDSSSIDFHSLAASERGAAWLRDQNERTIRSMLGALPEPSESDNLSLSLGSQDDSLGGDLALERDPRGKYYYTYTSGSSASQFQGSGDEEPQNGMSDGDLYVNNVMRGPRPTSMQLNWLAAQQIESAQNQRRSNDVYSIPIPEESPNHVIAKEFFPFLPIAGPNPELLTDCSNCGVLLDAIRYVCSTCGEKAPVMESTSGKGKKKDSSPQSTFSYPPPPHPIFSSPNSSSSRTYVGSSESFFDPQRQKPLPSIPSTPSSLTLHSTCSSSPSSSKISSLTSSQTSAGYELCSGCLESAGVHHAIEAGLSPPGSSPTVGSISPSHDDPQRALQWRRAAPKKGQLRHSYQEKAWGHMGWEDVVQDEAKVSRCSTCDAVTPRKRYKCASCPKIHLCRACYSQVHELHPSHAFLIVPDKPSEPPSNSDYLSHMMPEVLEELSLKHPGVKCAHCLLDIVGARFHCAICDSVDICSHCESAGLPGNLDSSDGGHNSSHILIKIPYPLETTELQNASRRALHLWSRDAASVGFAAPRSKADSEISYAQTLTGGGSRDGLSHSPGDHRILCNNCHRMIVGVRYQCGHCPTSPSSFNLCAHCEERSYIHHDPSHVFFKLPRPVDRPLESPQIILPPLYKLPAGPSPNAPQSNDPKAYLSSLVHQSAICDRCMVCIEGAWFRCCYCSRDLCEGCQEVDTHDDTHIFLVFKSAVDMQIFKSFANLLNPDQNSPVLSYPLYR